MVTIRDPGLCKPRVHTERIAFLVEKECKGMIKRCAERAGLPVSVITRCAVLWALGFDECSFIVAYMRNICEEGRPVEHRRLDGVQL